jgi:hypothetical protein
MAQAMRQIRTYGGWRRARSMGMFGLGPGASILVLGAITLPLFASPFGMSAFLVAAGPSAVVLAALLLRFDGVPIIHVLTRRWRWLVGAGRAQASYQLQVVADPRQARPLPGVLAPTRLLPVTDPGGGDFGVIWNARLGTMTATLRCAATSTWLADPDDADAWVANWGQWLAGLGYQPMVRQAAVIVDTAPDPGTRLSSYMARRIAPNSPPAAQRVLRELVAASPAVAADVHTWVAVTFHPAAAPSRPRNPSEAVAELARVLPGLAESLGSCGVAVLGRATAADLAAAVRGAYDPAARGTADQLSEAGLGSLEWEEAAPVAAREEWDCYRHDGAVSVSWAWHEAPRQQVPHDVLARLVSPGRCPKRVAWLWTPYSAGEAARIVEHQRNVVQFRQHYSRVKGRDESARDVEDRQRATQAAQEEAAGAGVGLLNLFVTTTVTDEAELPKAVADVESAADASKIRLRRCYAGQAAAFAATLPAGVIPRTLSAHWPH